MLILVFDEKNTLSHLFLKHAGYWKTTKVKLPNLTIIPMANPIYHYFEKKPQLIEKYSIQYRRMRKDGKCRSAHPF